MKTKVTRGEILAIFIPIMLCITGGACLGWVACSVTTRNKVLMATAERYEAERQYYERQACSIIAEGFETMNNPKAPARKNDPPAKKKKS